MSHAFTGIHHVEHGVYKTENILYATDVSAFIDRKKKRFKERILICTDERILYV